MGVNGRGANFLELCIGYFGHLGRGIAIPAVPDDGPEDAENSKKIKGSTPAEAGLDGHDEQGREGAANLIGHDHEAEGSCAFQLGKPAGDAGGKVREGAGFTRSKRKTNGKESPKVRSHTSEGSEDGPPKYDARQDSSRAVTVRERSGGNFEGGIRKDKDSADPTPGGRGDVKVGLHARAGYSNTDAVQIGDDRDNAQQQ